MMYRDFGKRSLDLIVASLSLFLLSPIFIVVGVLVYFKHGRPIIFQQQRPGKHGKPFVMFKFRTMNSARDADGNLLPDAVRLTRFGRFLRASSLDELPELINVLRGEMSLVGPRPLLMHYLDRYTTEQMRRHDVLPGITGWAQVNGRNRISWEEKFELDVWYVDNYSPALDLKIIARTLLKILQRDGISQPGQATAEEFKGSKV